jgi:hypothetical protein
MQSGGTALHILNLDTTRWLASLAPLPLISGELATVPIRDEVLWACKPVWTFVRRDTLPGIEACHVGHEKYVQANLLTFCTNGSRFKLSTVDFPNPNWRMTHCRLSAITYSTPSVSPGASIAPQYNYYATGWMIRVRILSRVRDLSLLQNL